MADTNSKSPAAKTPNQTGAAPAVKTPLQTATQAPGAQPAVAKPASAEKVSPKTRILNRAIAEITSCKTVEEAVKVLEEMKSSKGTSGRTKVNYDDIVVKNSKGEITHVKCAVSNLWFPVTEFSKAKTPIGVTPIHKKVKNAKSKFLAEIKKATDAVSEDFMSNLISADAFKAKIKALKSKEFDIKTIKLDGGVVNKPVVA